MPDINETLLEMHYYGLLRKFFEDVFGVKCIKVYKPTQYEEAWLGFDEAWVKTELSSSQLYERLKKGMQNGINQNDYFYFGLFLQFKVVEKIRRRSRHCPYDYNVPYYRATLSLSPARITGISQHETLVNLNNIDNANVAYACPMVFDHEDLNNPTLDNLFIIDISTAPTGWLTNGSHFITFQDINASNTKWCSIPTEGRSILFSEWIKEKFKTVKGQEIIDLIEKSESLLLPPTHRVEMNEPPFRLPSYTEFKEEKEKPTAILPECFSIFEFKRSD